MQQCFLQLQGGKLKETQVRAGEKFTVLSADQRNGLEKIEIG